MILTAGIRFGPYEILAPLGSGGMGEVYKARDARLDRTVAIKVLPSHVANDPELKQRFAREAKTLAALSHPHICPVFDVGQQDGIDFLVMEYLEGQTLAERLEKGALPLDQGLQYAIQMADALGLKSAAANFLPTAGGWPISRTNRAGSRFTCSRFQAQAASGRCRPPAAQTRDGGRTGRSYFSSRRTRS
jgi:aminoglycoside phosphotransferase (APT) family kinase protein